MGLSGRSYLVTGAQKGIGAAIAVKLAGAGANVAINYLDDPEAAAAVARRAQEAGGQALTVAGDVSLKVQVEAMVAATETAFGAIDGLVNNAGIFPHNLLVDIEEAEWDLVMRVNLKGVFLATQAAARAMIAGRRGGAIVNISSGGAVKAPTGAHYSASKGGVLSFTRTAAAELGRHGIRVNAIAPGIVLTDQPRGYWSDAEIEKIGRRSALGRIGGADEVADCALYLLSDAATYVTGETINVDGGI